MLASSQIELTVIKREHQRTFIIENIGKSLADEFDFSKGWTQFEFNIVYSNNFKETDPEPESFILLFPNHEHLELKFEYIAPYKTEFYKKPPNWVLHVHPFLEKIPNQ
jgi:hypothetical protein